MRPTTSATAGRGFSLLVSLWGGSGNRGTRRKRAGRPQRTLHRRFQSPQRGDMRTHRREPSTLCLQGIELRQHRAAVITGTGRSEEHTSELQSLLRHSSAVFYLKKHTIYTPTLSPPTS